MATKKPVGRQSGFTQAHADAICDRLISGESLRTICADETMPSASAVFKWLRDRPDFAQQYARAREAQADAFVEDILEIADNGLNDWMERRGDEDAGWVANGEHMQRSRLRVDARKWLMSKMAPKKYGEKLELAGQVGTHELTHEQWLAGLK